MVLLTRDIHETRCHHVDVIYLRIRAHDYVILLYCWVLIHFCFVSNHSRGRPKADQPECAGGGDGARAGRRVSRDVTDRHTTLVATEAHHPRQGNTTVVPRTK